MAALEGKILNSYQLRRLVGKGGMANVYEAQDLQFQRKVAVKVFKREDEGMLRRFIREARLMASLRHDHLVPIIDSGECQLDGDTRYYIVMPFLGGGTLRARIRRSPLPLPEACRYIREIASALDYIHGQGIVHRDIKASNVLLNAEGESFLTDFGIARVTTDATQLTSTGDVLGTVDYVAPELFEADHRADARSDLYSLGVLLFEMVTGRLPFIAENQIAQVSMHINKHPPSPRSIDPRIPSQVERVIFRALEKRPEQRYANATELAEVFCRAAGTSNKTRVPGRSDVAKIEQPGAVVPIAGINQPAFPTSSPAVNPVVRPSPLEDATEGYPFIIPPPDASVPSARPETPLPPLSPSPAPPGPRSPRRRRVAIALALLALVLLVTSFIAFVWPRTNPQNGNQTTGNSTAQTTTTAAVQSPANHPTATPNLTATALAVQAATATAHARETAIAIAGMTATAQAQASATAGVIQTATSGKPVYKDVLNNANSASTVAANWDQNGQCVFAPGGYHVKEGNSLHGCKESAYAYQNVAITVDVRILSGQTGGLFFRISTDFFGEYAGYLFEINSTGKYRISTSQRFNVSITPLQGWKFSSALRQGNAATNTLQVIARGSDLFFYANGVFLVQLKNTQYTSGVVGFLATSDGTTQADVLYSNLSVYPLT